MMSRVLPIATAVLADSIRKRVVYIVLLFAAVMAFAIPSLPNYGLGVESSVYREIALAMTYVAALVVTLALAAGRIPAEVERRTVYNVLSKGVSRWEYVLGTWLGVAAVMLGVMSAFTLVVQLIGLVRFGEPMWHLWQAGLAIWCEMGVIAAFTVAVSTVAGPVVVVVASLAGLFVGHSRATLIGEEPVAARLLFPSLDAFNVINPVSHGSGVSALYVVSMLVVFVGLAGVCLVIGALLFGRRDL